MDQGSAIHPLSDFQRDASDLIARLKQTGEPLVLTVDGKAELVVQDASSYQKMRARVEEAEILDGIRRGLQDIGAGRTQPVSEAFAEIRRELNLPPEP